MAYSLTNGSLYHCSDGFDNLLYSIDQLFFHNIIYNILSNHFHFIFLLDLVVVGVCPSLQRISRREEYRNDAFDQLSLFM